MAVFIVGLVSHGITKVRVCCPSRASVLKDNFIY